MARLDVAMFNAILRESSDEIPSDPVSDPISDLKVLPIPAGKSSFGAGAQLKSAVSHSNCTIQPNEFTFIYLSCNIDLCQFIIVFIKLWG